MTFLSDLRRELAVHGIRGRLADRIETELADHLACDPDAQLGAPAQIAERFAAELRVVRTRRASVGSFAALAVCPAMVVVAGFALNQTNAPTRGTPIAGLGMVVFAQIAMVAGVLALARGLRGRTPGDLKIAQRRALVALGAGAGFCVSLGVQTLAARPESLGWHAMGIACAVVPLPALAFAGRATLVAAAVTPAGDARGLEADLPGALGRHAPLVLGALGAVAVAVITFQGIVFEGSGWEGIIRGAIEAGGLGLGVAVFGRVLRLGA